MHSASQNNAPQEELKMSVIVYESLYISRTFQCFYE